MSKVISISPYAIPGIREDDRDLLNDAQKAERIIQKVSAYFDVCDLSIRSHKRSREFVVPRQWCMYFMKQKTGYSLNKIASYFSCRHHTTVMHSLILIRNQLSINGDNSFKSDFNNLVQII